MDADQAAAVLEYLKEIRDLVSLVKLWAQVIAIAGCWVSAMSLIRFCFSFFHRDAIG